MRKKQNNNNRRKINFNIFFYGQKLCALIIINGWIIIGFKHSFAAIMAFQPPCFQQ